MKAEPTIDAEQVPTITAYGDPDDHLRIPVLLAAHLRQHAPDAADACLLAKENPWTKRRKALEFLLEVVTKNRKGMPPVACLDDLDAMDPGRVDGERRWNDATFALQRQELITILVKYVAERSLFTVRRPSPGEDLSNRLGNVGLIEQSLTTLTDDVSENDEDAGPVGELPLELRPVARWLIVVKALDDVDLEEIVDEAIPSHLLTVAWDHLKPAVREDARRLCTFRAPMRANGTMGPFAWSSSKFGDANIRISPSSVQQLQAAGFLQETPWPRGGWSMPRTVRSFVYNTSSMRDPDRLMVVHGALAASMPDSSPEEITERHHQAIAADDEATARATACYYGADLRSLAVTKSRSAHELLVKGATDAAKMAFSRAARIYQEILTYDPEDAYAWEYCGYNLWQPFRESPQSAPDAVVKSVREAYKSACKFDSANPLFRGRLLALDAALRQPYTTELRRYSRSFYHRLGDAYLTWYFEPVLSVLKQQGRHEEIEVLKKWPGVRRAEHEIQRRKSGRFD